MPKPSSRKRDIELLQQEIGSGEYTELLRGLRKDAPFYQRFDTWADVVSFVRGRKLYDPEMDEVLVPIFRAHGEDNDPRWRQVLIVLFWPALESIQHQKLGMASDPFDLWQDIQCTFLEILCRIDLKKRPRRLASKVFYGTLHRVHEDLCRKKRQTGFEEFTADWDTLEDLARPVEGIDFAGIDWREWREGEIEKLRPYVDRGVISEADLQILVATNIDGLSAAHYGRRNGLKPATARKRRLRAEEAVREAGGEVPHAADGLEHIGVAVRS